MSKDILQYVFFYGTHKSREVNNFWLHDRNNGSANYVGLAKITEKRPLIVLSSFIGPSLLDIPGLGEYVEGEVYQVDSKMLKWLDQFEQHPAYYRRMKVMVNLINGKNDGLTIEAWAYVSLDYPPDLMLRPFYKSYKSRNFDLTEDEEQLIRMLERL